LWTEQNGYSPNVIGGYSGNYVSSGISAATISGGGDWIFGNSVHADFATIGGGLGNYGNGYAATIGGGEGNRISADWATVAGGYYNSAENWHSTVGGGYLNTASSQYSTVGGGYANWAKLFYSTVGGGWNNTASGSVATVPGGFQNIAGGKYSFAAGKRAFVRDADTVGGGDTNGDEGTFIWSDATVVDPDYFTSTGPNQFLINASGGVGIGTNNPNTSLNVKGPESTPQQLYVESDATSGEAGTGAGVGFGGHDGNTNRIWGILRGEKENASPGNYAGALVFRTRPHGAVFAERLRITSEGKVGIGTSTPAHNVEVLGWGLTRLQVVSNDDQAGIGLESDGDGEAVIYSPNDSDDLRFYVGGANRLSIEASTGSVGIGTDIPYGKLGVIGTVHVPSLGSNAGTPAVIDSGGYLRRQTSSARYKSKIRDLQPSSDAILDLRPVRFQWKSSGEEDIGLVAEEVDQVLKDLVIYDSEGKAEAVKYDRVSLYLLNVLKDQQAEIAALKERLAALEAADGESRESKKGGVR
jgi:hypothetical protein